MSRSRLQVLTLTLQVWNDGNSDVIEMLHPRHATELSCVCVRRHGNGLLGGGCAGELWPLHAVVVAHPRAFRHHVEEIITVKTKLNFWKKDLVGTTAYK